MFKNREITFNSYKNLYRKNLEKYVKKKKQSNCSEKMTGREIREK